MTDKPTFMRFRRPPEPLQSSRTLAKEEKGICSICGKELEKQVADNTCGGICTVVIRHSRYEGGIVVPTDVAKETIKRIYEKHVRSL